MVTGCESLYPKIVATPVGMPTIHPDADFMLIYFYVSLLNYIHEGREVPLDLLKVARVPARRPSGAALSGRATRESG